MAVLLVDCTLFLVAFVLFCTVWSVHNEAEHMIDMSNPLLPDHHVDRWIAYGPLAKNQWFTFETWNCALAPIIPRDHGAYPSKAFISSRCHQSQALRLLTLPLLLGSSIRAAIGSQAYHEHAAIGAAARRDEASDPLLQPEAAELGLAHHLVKRRQSAQHSAEAAAYQPQELLGSNPTMVELPGSSVQELAGSDGARELDAGNVAKELEGD